MSSATLQRLDDGSPRQAERGDQPPLADAAPSVGRANRGDHVGGELRRVSPRTAFPHPIGGVLGGRTEEQVSWVAAGRVVAAVADEQAARDLAVGEDPRETGGGHRRAGARGLAVTSVVAAARPRPTLVGPTSIHAGPEAFGGRALRHVLAGPATEPSVAARRLGERHADDDPARLTRGLDALRPRAWVRAEVPRSVARIADELPATATAKPARLEVHRELTPRGGTPPAGANGAGATAARIIASSHSGVHQVAHRHTGHAWKPWSRQTARAVRRLTSGSRSSTRASQTVTS